MIFQIAMGIFFGFLFLAVFVGVILGIAYIVSKEDEVPHFIEEPKKRKPHKTTKTSVKDWWDRYDEGDDY